MVPHPPLSFLAHRLKQNRELNNQWLWCLKECSIKRKDRPKARRPSFIITKARSRITAALHKAITTERRDGMGHEEQYVKATAVASARMQQDKKNKRLHAVTRGCLEVPRSSPRRQARAYRDIRSTRAQPLSLLARSRRQPPASSNVGPQTATAPVDPCDVAESRIKQVMDIFIGPWRG